MYYSLTNEQTVFQKRKEKAITDPWQGGSMFVCVCVCVFKLMCASMCMYVELCTHMYTSSSCLSAHNNSIRQVLLLSFQRQLEEIG